MSEYFSSEPKYIASLMKAAEQRKKEHERRTERKVQKAREAEGELSLLIKVHSSHQHTKKKCKKCKRKKREKGNGKN